MMATQTLPIRERRNWGATLGTFALMSTIAVSYIPTGKDANFAEIKRESIGSLFIVLATLIGCPNLSEDASLAP